MWFWGVIRLGPRPKRSEVPTRIPSIPHLLIPSPLTDPHPLVGRGGGGVPLCEPINEPQGPAVKFRLLQWIWAVCGRGAPKIPVASPSLPPSPLPPLPPLPPPCPSPPHSPSLALSCTNPTTLHCADAAPRLSCKRKSPRPGIMSSSQHTAGPRRTTRSV